MRRSLQAAAAALAFVTAAAALTAGHAPPSLQDPLTFRAGVQYVEVDVTVADRKGRLIRTLTKDDFELLEDGAPQKIEGFQVGSPGTELEFAL